MCHTHPYLPSGGDSLLTFASSFCWHMLNVMICIMNGIVYSEGTEQAKQDFGENVSYKK